MYWRDVMVLLFNFSVNWLAVRAMFSAARWSEKGQELGRISSRFLRYADNSAYPARAFESTIAQVRLFPAVTHRSLDSPLLVEKFQQVLSVARFD